MSVRRGRGLAHAQDTPHEQVSPYLPRRVRSPRFVLVDGELGQGHVFVGCQPVEKYSLHALASSSLKG